VTRDDFSLFVAKTLEEVVRLAEEKANTSLPRPHRLAFQWLGQSHPRITENIVEHVVQRVFVDDEHIYPCVDIGAGDLLEDGSLLIVGIVAGYPPCPFKKNWTGRDGPFVYIVGEPFLNRMAGRGSKWTPESIFRFVTPRFDEPS